MADQTRKKPAQAERLVANHLAFLRSHRGSVQQMGDLFLITSERPEFTYALLGQDSHLEDVPERFQMIQHFPWSAPDTSTLESKGWSRLMGISYMTLAADTAHWRTRSDLHCEEVTSPKLMERFSLTQARAFTETAASFSEWHPWLKAANDRNLHNPEQLFFIASLNGETIGTTLVVKDGKICGLYAVATLASHRKTGVSTSLMRQAIASAMSRGAQAITLQCKQDSYVEEFYRNLGFNRVFTTQMYRRKT